MNTVHNTNIPQAMADRLSARMMQMFLTDEYYNDAGQSNDPKDVTSELDAICAEYGWTMQQYERALFNAI